MTASATEVLALLAPNSSNTWREGILAAADLRERRARSATAGPYYVVANDLIGGYMVRNEDAPPSSAYGRDVADFMTEEDCHHIAAEANPAHALAAVHHWRGVVERHDAKATTPTLCAWCLGNWPCPDLQEVAAEARAYLGGEP